MIDLTPRRLTLLHNHADGEDARLLELRIETPTAADLAAQPGQFCMLSLPGQGEAPFTYVQPPQADGRFSALVRRTGRLTEALCALPEGALLGYRGPYGRGWPDALSSQQVLVIAGGCGLAPLAGLIDRLLAQQPDRVQVIYGARHAAAQVLGGLRQRWRAQNGYLETCDQAPPGQRQGSPLAHLDALFARQQPDCVLCCGPEPLMLASAEACLQRGVPATQIWLSLERRMHCGVGLCGHCHLGASYACVDGPTYSYAEYLQLQQACGAYAVPQAYRHC